jgi:hypothetical protein
MLLHIDNVDLQLHIPPTTEGPRWKEDTSGKVSISDKRVSGSRWIGGNSRVLTLGVNLSSFSWRTLRPAQCPLQHWMRRPVTTFKLVSAVRILVWDHLLTCQSFAPARMPTNSTVSSNGTSRKDPYIKSLSIPYVRSVPMSALTHCTAY